MEWSAQQDAALKSVRDWIRNPGSKQILRLFGYAGSGKTTLAIEMANMLRRKVLYAAFTGKAASVMQRKGCSGASTLHSLIYKVRDGLDGRPEFTLNFDSDLKEAGLLVVDECSMVGEELATDVLSFGTPVLVIGDPAQLPPVKDAGFFTEREPDVMLTEIHRQARDNPIIRLATDVREGKRLPLGEFVSPSHPGHVAKVIQRDRLAQSVVMGADQTLVGLNRTRRSWNDKIRKIIGREQALPEVGDKLVCLKNDREHGLLNGTIWHVKEMLAQKTRDHGVLRMILIPEDADMFSDVEVVACIEPFLDEKFDVHSAPRGLAVFDFGYALTVHKSQGSQWNNVLVNDESFVFKEHRNRHLYTAISRAAERVTVVVN